VSGSTTSFAYDGDDTRASATSGGTTTPYLWDRLSGLPLLVGDGSQSYLHAGGVVGSVDGAGAASYALTDGIGSVRGRTDGAGAVVGSSDYDAFGVVRASSGTGGIFGFAGEQTESATGQLYLRARYYAPGLGRFLSVDPEFPGGGGTQGYNPYPYAGNNPGTWGDPSGRNPACLAAVVTGPFAPATFTLCEVITVAVVAIAAGGVAVCAANASECIPRALPKEDDEPWLEPVPAPTAGVPTPVSTPWGDVVTPSEPQPQPAPVTPTPTPQPPIYVYRKGNWNLSTLTPRPEDEGRLSTWTSLDPRGLPGFFKPGDKYFAINTVPLPKDRVIYDNEPLDHVSIVNVDPAILLSVSVPGRIPK